MPSPGRPAVAAGILAVLMALTGCGDDAASSTASDPGSAPSTTDKAERAGGEPSTEEKDGASDPPTTPAEIPEVLDFTATQVSGEEFAASNLAGGDTVFWFWAPWCTECAAAAPAVQAAADAADDVAFVGVAGLSSDVGAMQGFVDQHGLEFPQLADADGSIYTRFGVIQQDTFALVDADGSVELVDAYGGDVDLEQLVADTFG